MRKIFVRTSILSVAIFSLATLSAWAKTEIEEEFYGRYTAGVNEEKIGNTLSAVKNYQQALKYQPKDYDTLLKLGLLYLNNGGEGSVRESGVKQAVDFLKKAETVRQSDPMLYLLLGKAYEELGDKSGAIVAYSKATTLDPENILLKSNLGRLYFENKDFKNSIEIFNKVILAYPDNLKARAYLGAALQSTDNYLSAIEQYNYVLDYTPDEYSILKNIGDSWLALGKYDKAKENYLRAKDVDPNVPNIYADLAFVAKQEKDYDAAIENYKKALKLKNNEDWKKSLAYSYWFSGKKEEAVAIFTEVKNYAVAAYIYQNLGKKEEAINYYKKALELNQKDIRSRFNLARIYHESKQLDLAQAEYEKVLEQKPSDVETLFLLATLRQEKGDLDIAMNYYNELLGQYLASTQKLDDTSKLIKNNVHYNLGLAYKSQQKLDMAEKNFEELIKDGPGDFAKDKEKNVYKELSFIKIALGKNIEAERIITDWLREDPTNVEARNLYADFLVHLDKERKAVEQLRLASVLDKTTTTRLKLANLLHSQNNFYDALAEYQFILKEDPNNLNALLGAANNFKALGFRQEAVNIYKEALAKYPNDVLLNYNYGLLMHEENNYDQARQYYEKIISLNPNFLQAYYVLGLVYWDSDQKDRANETWSKFLTSSADDYLKNQIKAILETGVRTNQALKQQGIDPNSAETQKADSTIPRVKNKT